MSKKVIMFDLDGTLLPMDTESFINSYIKELAKRVASLVDPKDFVKALWGGTEAMLKNLDSSMTNEKVFEERFLSMLTVERDEIWPILDDFYNKEFLSFENLTTPTPIARKVVEEAIEQGFSVVVATNPLFPKVAIYHRLAWAGVDDLPFAHVTYYENSTFTKPHVEYYQSICDQLGADPKNVIMIGNDKQEDMSSSKLGIKTFLVEGHVIDRGEPNYPIDDQGTLEDLYEKIQKREGIFA